jgi:hypothetical protein
MAGGTKLTGEPLRFRHQRTAPAGVLLGLALDPQQRAFPAMPRASVIGVQLTAHALAAGGQWGAASSV